MSPRDSMLDYGFIFSPAIQVNSGIKVKGKKMHLILILMKSAI